MGGDQVRVVFEICAYSCEKIILIISVQNSVAILGEHLICVVISIVYLAFSLQAKGQIRCFVER